MKSYIVTFLILFTTLFSSFSYGESKFDVASKNMREYKRRYLYLIQISNQKEVSSKQLKNVNKIINETKNKLLDTRFFPFKGSMVSSLEEVQYRFSIGDLKRANFELTKYQKFIKPLLIFCDSFFRLN